VAFDQTYIAIRRRSILEIIDLSLHLVRDHLLPLLVLWLIGVTPFMLADWLVTRSMAADIFDNQRLMLYYLTMTLLVINQAQVGTWLITSYLGQAMFSPRPAITSVLKSAVRVNPWIVWIQGVLRLVIPVFAVACFLGEERRDDMFVTLYSLFVGLALLGCWIRCLRPFAMELLLLEKTPVGKVRDSQISYALRSASFHQVARPELTARFLVMSLFCVPLFMSLLGSLLLIDSTLNLHDQAESAPVILYWPIALWLVAGIMAATRYLSYVDLRIRQEGWEIELRMRAEALRLQQTWSISQP
jgi:hypothetical protein